uniref:Uncharacterized protein n=1 Tax=Rhizophora mucronata TaxID=61149 RepID=A0A2P2NYM3_RHIMU
MHFIYEIKQQEQLEPLENNYQTPLECGLLQSEMKTPAPLLHFLLPEPTKMLWWVSLIHTVYNFYELQVILFSLLELLKDLFQAPKRHKVQAISSA